MHSYLRSQIRVLLVLLLVPLLAAYPAARSYADHAVAGVSSHVEVVQARARPAPAVASPAPAAQARVFVPLVRTPAKITFQFAASKDANGNLINPSTVIAYGTRTLYANRTVGGARGRSYRHEWYINGVLQPQLAYGPVTIPFDITLYRVEIYTTDRPLDRGVYQVNSYLGESLYATASATIK
jgi:hypothetical protein